MTKAEAPRQMANSMAPPVVPGIRTTAGDQHADGSSFEVPSRLPAQAKAKTAKNRKDLNDNVPF